MLILIPGFPANPVVVTGKRQERLMNNTDETKNAATRYLLGAATAEEQAALEESYFSNPDAFQQVVAAEKELLDDYAYDRLSREDRAQFESHYLSHPRRRARAKTAIALAEKIRHTHQAKPEPEQRRGWLDWWSGWRMPVFAFGMAAAVLLLALGSFRLWSETRRLRAELDQSRVAQSAVEERQRELRDLLSKQQAREDQLLEEIQRLRVPQPTPTASSVPSFASLLLIAGLTRGNDPSDTPRLILAPGVKQVRLQLKLQDVAYPRYRLSLETAAGERVSASSQIQPSRSKILTFVLPRSLFSNGEYVLVLSGGGDGQGDWDSLSKTIFRVEQKEN